MRISELRASHLSDYGDRATVTRADGVNFIVKKEWDQGGWFYRVMADDAHATFGHADGSGTSTTLRGVAALIRDAVIVETGTAAATYRFDISRRADQTTGKLSLTAREFLGTRMAVAGVCAALGVTPEDGVVEECLDDDGNATADIAGWTYMDGWGSIIYMVQYANGKIGAQFGSQSIYADSLDLAELQLFEMLCGDSEAALSDLYSYWLDREGLPAMSAEELIFEDLTPAQRTWVSIFIHVWDNA